MVVQYAFGLSQFFRVTWVNPYSLDVVIEDIKEFLPATLELALFSGLFMAFFGILLGILSARHSNTWVDNLIRVFAYIGIATPAFVVAIILLLVFGMYYQVFPTIGRLSQWVDAPTKITGLITIDSLLTGNLTAFLDALKHLMLPAFSLALGGMFQEARITRSSMLENSKKDYVSAARSYGIPERTVILNTFSSLPLSQPSLSLV